MTATAITTTATTTDCTLDIGGMTCASCVGRVERALRKLGGVDDARVNLATEVATVTYDPTVLELDDLIRAVTRAGYTAAPVDSGPTEEPAGDETEALELHRLKRRWQITLAAGEKVGWDGGFAVVA